MLHFCHAVAVGVRSWVRYAHIRDCVIYWSAVYFARNSKIAREFCICLHRQMANCASTKMTSTEIYSSQKEMLDEFEAFKRETHTGWRCVSSNSLFSQYMFVIHLVSQYFVISNQFFYYFESNSYCILHLLFCDCQCIK